MRISIDAPHAKEHFETAREYLILDPERIVGNPEVIPRMAVKSALLRQSNSVKTFVRTQLRRSRGAASVLQIFQFGWVQMNY
jgi:hypothetical protein